MNIRELEQYSLHIYDMKHQFRDEVYLRSLAAFQKGDLNRDSVQTKQGLKERQARLRTAFIESIGGLPSSDSPLCAQITRTVVRDGFRIENIIFESRPQHYVTANLYIPDGLTEPTGAVVFVCGHDDEGKMSIQYQRACQHLTQAGLIVFCMDPIGQGERYSYYDADSKRAFVRPSTDEHELVGAQCWSLGYGLARYFVHDIMRSIDYLSGRAEVNPEKIGITGNSGGGLQTAMAMICDDRVAAAAPGTFIMTRESFLFTGLAQDAEQIWPGFSSSGFDHEDLLLSMAPRPVIVLAVTEDFFPIEGTRRAVERARRFWDLDQQSDALQLYEEVSGHRYTEGMALAVARFFSRHFGMSGSYGKDGMAHVEELDFSLLHCTESGQVRGDYPGARAVRDENIAHLQQLEAGRLALGEAERYKRAVAWLEQKVVASRKTGSLNPRYPSTFKLEREGLAVRNVFWRSHDTMFNYGLEFRDERKAKQALPVTIAFWEGGTKQLSDNWEWIQQTCAEGQAVFVADLTGIGELEPYPIGRDNIYSVFGTMHKLTTDLFWIGDSLAAMRVHDVLRAVEMAQILKDAIPGEISMFARGRYSIYAELAHAIASMKWPLEVVEEIDSLGAWVRAETYPRNDVLSIVIPGMLAYFDLPELRTWRKEARSLSDGVASGTT